MKTTGNTTATATTEKKTKFNFRRVRTFRQSAITYMELFPAETKLKFALEKVFKGTDNIEEEFQKKVTKIELKLALEGKDGEVLYENNTNGGRKFKMNKEGLENRDKEVEKLMLEKPEADFDPHFVDVPKGLHMSWQEYFAGFVLQIKPDKLLN